ncbi:hypothetical protein [Amycolatopsis panacis]|uniref:DUF5666 domain-containing protein n=1 Tax=Amycolatopsis panacis TaxID=2340917 RepID=A0A419I559_9PSEU|nr:hypothetical protein [Amycolatopsis panacis]RJQ85800.1 hypothetical protein D5S19_12885 [Amycolatopsis panacis]
MTTDPAQGATWGEPPAPGTPPGKTWSGRKTAIAAGVAVVIAAGGGIAIWAGTSSNDASAQQRGPGGQGGPGGMMGPGGFGGAGGMSALRGALHGDFVVAGQNGSYVTERLQTGTVSELSATSVTLTSKDGYKQTYTLNSDTEKSGNPQDGRSSTVIAKVEGGTATAISFGQEQSFGPGRAGPRPYRG